VKPPRQLVGRVERLEGAQRRDTPAPAEEFVVVLVAAEDGRPTGERRELRIPIPSSGAPPRGA
jgi:hypothetical protein